MLLAQEKELSRAEGATEGTPSSAQTTPAARYKSAIVRVCSGSLIRRHELSIHFKSVGRTAAGVCGSEHWCGKELDAGRRPYHGDVSDS